MSVSVYECDARSVAALLIHTPLLLHVRASRVAVVPAVLSRSVAVAQSYVTLSVQTTRYQKVRVPPAAGALKVCATELSPLNGDVLPTLAAATPVCDAVEVAALPLAVHPDSPLSNPPFVIPDGGGGGAAPMLASS